MDLKHTHAQKRLKPVPNFMFQDIPTYTEFFLINYILIIALLNSSFELQSNCRHKQNDESSRNI